MRMWTSVVAPALAHHADDFAAGGAADDGIVDQHHALAFEERAARG